MIPESDKAAPKKTATSPASAGPSGANLESHVGAQYLLPLLSGGEARGLPGVVVKRVAFQRADLNHPMDDVIVTGHDRQGRPATIELQVKRTINFTAKDRIFAVVVAQACRAATKHEFKMTRYELAVAIGRTSTKIERYIQDVLNWARVYQESEDFFDRLNQPGAAHQEMRDFVEAFRGHMRTAGGAHGDADVYLLLSRFQVLAFDFEQPGSVCAQLARDRCVLQLASQDTMRAADLWDSLGQIALEIDSAGGDLDTAALREELTSKRGYRLAGDRQLNLARERMAEISQSALSDISMSVRGVTVDRGNNVAAALSALEQGRYLEILGDGGVGKSGVLKDLAQRIGVESRIFVIAPYRIPGGGWTALAAQISCTVSALEFLTDLAGDGGGTLFVDGIDRFDDSGQRATVVDLISAAAQIPMFSVVVTARSDFDADARAWMPTQALQNLGVATPLIIAELNDDEVLQLRNAEPRLSALLRPGHPTEKLVRNLYRLDRLARSEDTKADIPFTEAQMAWQWWTTGDSADASGRLDRRRLLRSLAVHSFASSASMEDSSSPEEAVTALIESGSIRTLSSVRVELAHDVLRDWAIGCLLHEDLENLAELELGKPAPVRFVRGIEIAARLHVDIHSDVKAWRVLLDRVSEPDAHGSWKRTVLLALARSERAQEALNCCFPALSAEGAELLTDLVRAAINIDSQPAAPIWASFGVDTSKFTDDIVVPRGPAWLNLIIWSLAIGDHLPNAAVPQFVDLYNRWCGALAGQDLLSPQLVARLYEWLVEVETKNHPKVSDFKAWRAAKEAHGLSMSTGQESDLRMAFLLWCKLRPIDAESYLQGVATHPHRHALFRQLLPFLGTAPIAAPKALTDLFLQVLTEGDNEEEMDRRSPMLGVFSTWDLEYFPASPARAPFFDLLQASSEQGLRLVRSVVADAIRQLSRGHEPGDNSIDVPLSSGQRSFTWCQTYMWSHSSDSSIVSSALMAMEAWAHQRIECGEPVQAVIDDVLGPEESLAAYLLVAVDVMLSHWPKTRDSLWPYAATAELLAFDRDRFAYDFINANGSRTKWVHPEPASSVSLDSLLHRPSRRIPLDKVLDDFGLHGPTDVREAMRDELRGDIDRLGAPNSESRGYADPRFAAMSALNRLDPTNYIQEITGDGRPETIEYIPPVDEARILAEMGEKVDHGNTEDAIKTQLMLALTNPRCHEQLLEQGVSWATGDTAIFKADLDKDEQEWVDRTRFIVAALVMRDGSKELKVTHGDWARAQLIEAAKLESVDRGFVKQLPYNLHSITAIGFLAAYRDDASLENLSSLLHLAVKRETAMVSVLQAELAAQSSLCVELQRSFVRLGLVSAIYAVRQRDSDDFNNIDDYRSRQQVLEAARKEVEKNRLQSAVAAELDWLSGDGQEPSWPSLPSPKPCKERHGISLGKPKPRQKRSPLPSPEFALASSEAASWLTLGVELWQVSHPNLLGELVQHCWSWTAGANGVACQADEEPGELAYEWNDAYFAAALAAAVSITGANIDEYLLNLLDKLPDERFFDASKAVLHALDQLWLGSGVVTDSVALSIREELTKRLVATRSWQRLASERSARTEIHLADAVAAIFLGQHNMGQGSRCYVLLPGVARAYLLLPILTQLVEQAAGSTFVSIAFLELLEVKPHKNSLMFLARAVAAWWKRQNTSTEFWIDSGVGRRLCDWIDKVMLSESVSQKVLDSAELAAIMDILVQCGTPLARSLEERLDARRNEATR